MNRETPCLLGVGRGGGGETKRGHELTSYPRVALVSLIFRMKKEEPSFHSAFSLLHHSDMLRGSLKGSLKEHGGRREKNKMRNVYTYSKEGGSGPSLFRVTPPPAAV